MPRCGSRLFHDSGTGGARVLAGMISLAVILSPMSDNPAPAKPSASVALVRDGDAAIEVLLVRRNDKVVFHGGAWVFPGGRVDDTDRKLPDDGHQLVARRAAVREAHEETGLIVDGNDMVQFAHWTTPIQLPKRFSTWFFVVPYRGEDMVKVDESEIVDARWITVQAALAERDAGEIELPGPAYISLLGFRHFTRVDELMSATAAAPVQAFVPRLVKGDDFRCAVYAEDAAYESLDLDQPGPRHRLMMHKTDWSYVREL